MYYQSKRYCPVLVAQEGSALWGNTLATALLHDQNATIPFGLIVLQYKSFEIFRSLKTSWHPSYAGTYNGDLLLPCQWKYWHRAKNRLRDKTGFVMYNPQNVEKSGFGQSVCVAVCLAVCLLSLFSRALTGVRFNRSS